MLILKFLYIKVKISILNYILLLSKVVKLIKLYIISNFRKFKISSFIKKIVLNLFIFKKKCYLILILKKKCLQILILRKKYF